MVDIHIKKDFFYIGVDETGLSVGNKSIVVVAAATKNKVLSEYNPRRQYWKAKDYLRAVGAYRAQKLDLASLPELPSLPELQANGVDDYHWVRATTKKYNRQVLEHAAIAHVIQSNGYSPQETVVLIDAFYPNHAASVFFIAEYLKKNGFNIPYQNIEIYGWGDQCVPIINYADIIAFQIGLMLNRKYAQFNPRAPKFDIDVNDHNIPFKEIDEKRTQLGIEPRLTLEEIIAKWGGTVRYRRK